MSPYLEQFPIPTGELHYFWLVRSSLYQGQDYYFTIMLQFVFIAVGQGQKLHTGCNLPCQHLRAFGVFSIIKICEEAGELPILNALSTKQNSLFLPCEADQ